MYKFILLISFFFSTKTFSQHKCSYVSRYYLLEIQYPEEENKINFLRLALLPRNKNIGKWALENFLKNMNSIDFNKIKLSFTIYNFIPNYVDSYLKYRTDTSDFDSQNLFDTSKLTNFYIDYLKSLSKGKKINIISDIIVLQQDSTLIKVSELTGRILVADFEMGIDVLFRNRRIKVDFLSKPNSGTDSSINTNGNKRKEFLLNDVFIPCKQKFILQGGEDNQKILFSKSAILFNKTYCNHTFINRNYLHSANN
jgi:hypothetical protein